MKNAVHRRHFPELLLFLLLFALLICNAAACLASGLARSLALAAAALLCAFAEAACFNGLNVTHGKTLLMIKSEHLHNACAKYLRYIITQTGEKVKRDFTVSNKKDPAMKRIADFPAGSSHLSCRIAFSVLHFPAVCVIIGMNTPERMGTLCWNQPCRHHVIS